jgi:hypothetical protein
MSVGKGSIIRAAQANDAVKDAAQEMKVTDVTVVETVKQEGKAKSAAPAKRAPAKKTQQVKTEVIKTEEVLVRASVISSSDNIHEKKFEAVSHIYSELPVYLL